MSSGVRYARNALTAVTAIALVWAGIAAGKSLSPGDPSGLEHTPEEVASVARTDAGEAPGHGRYRHRPAAVPKVPVKPQPITSLAPEVCVQGTWTYDDNDNVNRPSDNVMVQLWEKDSTSPDDLLTIGLTRATGAYGPLCSPNDDTDDAANDGLDLYVRVVTENAFWRVQNTTSGEPFTFDLPVVTGLVPGTPYTYTIKKPDAGTFAARSLQAFDSIGDFWNWQPGNCWDTNDYDNANASDPYKRCGRIVVNWHWNSAAANSYDSARNEVHLGNNDAHWADTVVREAAKAVLDDIFEQDFPDTNGCVARTNIAKATSAECAWVEGLADWVALRVNKDPVLDRGSPTVQHLELDKTDWETPGWDWGEKVEARVAGALLDMSDSDRTGVDTPWDWLSEGDSLIWTALHKHDFNTRRYPTFNYFMWYRIGDGDFGASGSSTLLRMMQTIFQNTIDWGLRDYVNAAWATRPTPVPPHNWQITTTKAFWSIVALRPPAVPADYDLDLFTNWGMSGTPAARSAAGQGKPDFVLIDSNGGRQPLGNLYAQSFRYSGNAGTGSYSLKFVEGSVVLGTTAATGTLSATEPVAIWDTFVTSGSTVKLEVTAAAGQDLALYLYCSTKGVGSTYLRNLSSSASGTGPTKFADAGTSGTETLTWVAPTLTDPNFTYCGVVLLNKAGSGTFSIKRLP